MAKFLCSYLCLFDIIVELNAMDEKHSMTFILYVINSYLDHDVWFIYVVEAFITVN